jgi:hypothetical protein
MNYCGRHGDIKNCTKESTMSKRESKKNEPIKLNTKKPWEVGRGHTAHRGGSGQHDPRPKRERTRKNINDKAIKEQL